MGKSDNPEKQDRAETSLVRFGISRIFHKALVGTEGVFCTIAVLCLIFISLFMGAEIIARYVFDHPLPGVYDTVYLLMVWVVCLSLAYTQRVGRHIKVTLFVSRFPSKIRNGINTAILTVTFAFCAIVTWKAYGYALKSLVMKEFISGVFNLPMYPSKLVLFIGALLLTIRFLVDALASLRRGRD